MKAATTSEVLDQFRAALIAREIVPPETIIADGRLHRCHAAGARGRGTRPTSCIWTGADAVPVFVEAGVPSDDELHALLHTVIARLMKMLTRRGVLIEEMGQTYLADPNADGHEARTLRPLQAAAITYRIAFDPRAGQKVLTLGGAMARQGMARELLCSDIDGFSLHAAVRVEAHKRKRLEQLCRYPKFGDMLVRDVVLPQVMAVIEPIWSTKTETAVRLRGRIESVLDWATVREYRTGANPARWKGHLDTLLPAPGKVADKSHHAALPAGELGKFMQDLRQQQGTGARALEFTILTAARSGEVRGATWSEIDLAAKVWTVPASRMKAKKEHRVPLSDAAIAILQTATKVAGTDLVFPAPRGGKLSDMTLTAVTRRMGANAVPHGFRSTFRDWCAERTNYPRDVAEMALAHTIGDKVEAAYRRGDLFDKRALLMAEWATFCAKVESKGEVVPINAKVA